MTDTPDNFFTPEPEPIPSPEVKNYPGEQDAPIMVSFGGGTNSTAMLCGFRERGIIPSLIGFADTGGEMPQTYDHVQEMDDKCIEWWGIGITVVRKLYRGAFEGLEKECIRGNQLPSLAYGGKHCSVKYKADPQTRQQKIWMREQGVTLARKAIGFGIDEPWRVKEKFAVIHLTKKLTCLSWYPLVEWQWRRVDCYAAIKRHGITQPGKSSCFFCPAKKPAEVLELQKHNPDLFHRGLAIEAAAAKNAKRNNGREFAKLGLGLHFGTKWSDIAAADEAQGKLFEWVGEHATPRAPCGCYDG